MRRPLRFIKELCKSTESGAFMRGIFGLCNGLNLCITAEGIESNVQTGAAFRYGAHLGQGFLFGETIPGSAVSQFLSGWRSQPVSEQLNWPRNARFGSSR